MSLDPEREEQGGGTPFRANGRVEGLGWKGSRSGWWWLTWPGAEGLKKRPSCVDMSGLALQRGLRTFRGVSSWELKSTRWEPASRQVL